MVLSDKISHQSVNAVTQRPQAPAPPIILKNMPWSQVVARKRTSLMNATFEHNIHNTHGPDCETISITNRSRTTKEGSRKIAEINFDPSDSAIDHILKDGITFENDAVRLLPCRALDPAVPLVRLRLSNLPFLKEDILKEQLKMSLGPYGSVLDLGILRESHTAFLVVMSYQIRVLP
ncbi:hypothetical protein G6F43_013854 [Rhizopus delemar]|nr:hypothetical protein G6F43_013854 [Rhizopus delemar]